MPHSAARDTHGSERSRQEIQVPKEDPTSVALLIPRCDTKARQHYGGTLAAYSIGESSPIVRSKPVIAGLRHLSPRCNG
jgi:hypothetical protein